MPGQVNEFPELLREVWRFDGRERRVNNGRVATPSRFFTVVHRFRGQGEIRRRFRNREQNGRVFPPRCIILFRRKVGNTWQSFRPRCMRVCLCFVLDRKSLVGCEVDRVTIASLMGMEGKCNTMMKCDLFNIIFRWRNMGNIYSSNMVRK